MIVVKVGFPAIIIDNEATYFSYLVGFIESVDKDATIQITKKPNSINIRISPSHPKFTSILIEEIKKFHNLFGIKLDFSKSMKTSLTVNFNIEI